MELDLLKEIPGYKAILKSVLKAQIQLLIEQLHEQAGEESIILTASLSDGTLSHLGSSMGKGFFEGRDEIKSQFLGYCLKSHHSKEDTQHRIVYQEDQPPDLYEHGPSLTKRPKFQPGTGADIGSHYEDQHVQTFSSQKFASLPNPFPNRRKSMPKKTQLRPSAKTVKLPISTPVSDDNNMPITVKDSGSLDGSSETVKVEHSDTQNTAEESTDDTVNISESIGVSSSVSLSQTQTMSSETANEEDSKDSNMSGVDQSDESSLQSNIIKVEPAIEEELAITGVEMAGASSDLSGDWGQNMSGESFYQPVFPGSDLFNQTGGQLNVAQGYEKEGGIERNEDNTSPFQSAQKKYSCRYCGKSFPIQSRLERHVRIHSDQRDFICPHCTKGFNRKDHLKAHIWNKHTKDKDLC